MPNSKLEHPDAKKHFYVSLAKSALRICAGGALYGTFFALSGILFILAEILGIVGELV